MNSLTQHVSGQHSQPENNDFCEIARILAAGILRLHARTAIMSDPGQNPAPGNLSESGKDCLEVLDEIVVSVHGGLPFPRHRERTEP